jgi:hypothetical protein
MSLTSHGTGSGHAVQGTDAALVSYTLHDVGTYHEVLTLRPLAALPGTWQLKVESRLDTSRNPQEAHTRYTTTLDREALKALRNAIEQALRSKTPDQESGLTLGAAPSQVLQPPMAP